MRVYSSRRWDFPSLPFSSSIVHCFPLSLFALHPHFTLISSPPSCSLWCSFNFPMLVCFLVFASAPESSSPQQNLLVHLTCGWRHTAENEPSRQDSWQLLLRLGEVEFRTLQDTFSPRKYLFLITVISCKETHTKKKLDVFGQISY